MFGQTGQNLSLSALKDFSSLPSYVRQHLNRVYLTLLGTILASTIGAITDIHFHIGGILTLIGTFICIIALAGIPHSKDTIAQRFAILIGLGFLQGCSLGGLLQQVIDIDPRIITTAFLGTSTIFICFSLCALLSSRRSWLFLGGFLSSALTILFIGGIVNIFFQSYFWFSVQLYGGLLMFCGFVIFDTQLIVEKAARGDTDFIQHSLSLFMDFVNIFVRLLIILAKDKKKDEKRR